MHLKASKLLSLKVKGLTGAHEEVPLFFINVFIFEFLNQNKKMFVYMYQKSAEKILYYYEFFHFL